MYRVVEAGPLPRPLDSVGQQEASNFFGQDAMYISHGSFDSIGIASLVYLRDIYIKMSYIWGAPFLNYDPQGFRLRLNPDSIQVHPAETDNQPDLEIPLIDIRRVNQEETGIVTVSEGGFVLPPRRERYVTPLGSLTQRELLEALNEAQRGHDFGIQNDRFTVARVGLLPGNLVAAVTFDPWFGDPDMVIINPQTRQLEPRQIVHPFA